LSKGWDLQSSLRQVIFESAESLRIMIQAGIIDLGRKCEILIGKSAIFPGYSLEVCEGVENHFRLVKNEPTQ
jgi:hypothetical protein